MNFGTPRRVAPLLLLILFAASWLLAPPEATGQDDPILWIFDAGG